MRNSILTYIKSKYNTDIEHLWKKYPDYGVFRHSDNRKWYGIIMNIPKNKLGIDDDEYVDVLNVKLGDDVLYDILLSQPGYFEAYHMKKSTWVSILLDGTIPIQDIYNWIDMSYMETSNKKRRRA